MIRTLKRTIAALGYYHAAIDCDVAPRAGCSASHTRATTASNACACTNTNRIPGLSVSTCCSHMSI
jgi:hypothetical protein